MTDNKKFLLDVIEIIYTDQNGDFVARKTHQLYTDESGRYYLVHGEKHYIKELGNDIH